ncbi:MAG: XdhC family protein [Desulfomonile sp.]|nr:XdhC family protein [Desulfomonile sp.]
MAAVWKAALEQFEQGRDFVLATILSVRGSSPRHSGTRFLVRDDGSIAGTIGGGRFEAEVQQFALKAIKDRTSHRVSFSFRGQDAHSSDMICGGDAEVLVEFVHSGDTVKRAVFGAVHEVTQNRSNGLLFTLVSIPPNSIGEVKHLLVDKHIGRVGGFAGEEAALACTPELRLLKPSQLLTSPEWEFPVLLEWLRTRGTVYIFGAGHVGECVAQLARFVDFSVVVIDDRADFANFDRIPAADRVVVTDYPGCFAQLDIDEDSYVVIVTRGHAHDRTVLSQALRTPACYVGMIGSRRKTRIVFDALLEAGFTQADIARVHAPIGLPIGGETPQEIAVSILAQMIQVRSGKDRAGEARVCPA